MDMVLFCGDGSLHLLMLFASYPRIWFWFAHQEIVQHWWSCEDMTNFSRSWKQGFEVPSGKLRVCELEKHHFVSSVNQVFFSWLPASRASSSRTSLNFLGNPPGNEWLETERLLWLTVIDSFQLLGWWFKQSFISWKNSCFGLCSINFHHVFDHQTIRTDLLRPFNKSTIRFAAGAPFPLPAPRQGEEGAGTAGHVGVVEHLVGHKYMGNKKKWGRNIFNYIHWIVKLFIY